MPGILIFGRVGGQGWAPGTGPSQILSWVGNCSNGLARKLPLTSFMFCLLSVFSCPFYGVTPRRDSPAFRADILPGDVIISVNGSEVTGLPDAMAIQQLAGQTITIGINRRGSTITKQLALPAGDW